MVMNDNNLAKLKDYAHEFGVSCISNVVLDDERFPIWTGSARPESHHYGYRGLIQHTLEVVELCLTNNEYFKLYDKGVNDCKLFLAALFHDVAKMDDYAPLYKLKSYNKLDDITIHYLLNDWVVTKHKYRIHHVHKSAIIWSLAAKEFLFEDSDEEVLHAILAHHGMPEWGSSVTPKDRLAWILHLSDCMSARVDDCVKK